MADQKVENKKELITGFTQVRLVSDIDKAKAYYRDVLGFKVDGFGHATREKSGFILQPAVNPEDIKPNTKASYSQNGWEGPPTSWDTYIYSDYDGVKSLYEEFKSRGAVIAYEPQEEKMGSNIWLEFAVKDLDGYVIVFGGDNS